MSGHTVGDALMTRTAQHRNDSELRRAAENRPPLATLASSNQHQKDAERAELERLMAEFKRRGGKVQVIGCTAIKKPKSRRQATTEEASRRIGQQPKGRADG